MAVFGILLVLTLFFAPEVKGATRWLPIFGVPLQPSEFVKPARGGRHRLAAVAPARAWRPARRPLLLVLPVLAVLVLQPDIGMTAVVAAVFGVQLFVAGLGWFWVLLLLGVARDWARGRPISGCRTSPSA